MNDELHRLNYRQTLRDQGYSAKDADALVTKNPPETARRVSRERQARFKRRYGRKGRSKY